MTTIKNNASPSTTNYYRGTCQYSKRLLGSLAFRLLTFCKVACINGKGKLLHNHPPVMDCHQGRLDWNPCIQQGGLCPQVNRNYYGSRLYYNNNK